MVAVFMPDQTPSDAEFALPREASESGEIAAVQAA